MDIENDLTRKILDPIHGIIRLTALEMDFINHPLYQRLRNIKQNSFLYKVFPSAVHSRFEHSLGVLHLSSEIIKNLHLNAIRYGKKYNDGQVFNDVTSISKYRIQELRLAALLHDIGHGPMSHQFESFMPTKNELLGYIEKDYHDILDTIAAQDGKVEHEHISLIFCHVIFQELKTQGRVHKEINVHNIFKIIDKKYGDQKIIETIKDVNVDILPLMTSIISSCPIDADRMDYLLRDSYFSGVKCGLYDFNRLFMSIVPVKENDRLFLAYKESGIDSIAEFIGARSSLFFQVYYHKTNRAFSVMLNKVCENMTKENSQNLILSDLDIAIDEGGCEVTGITALKNFYLDCSDDYFLNEKVPEWIESNSNDDSNEKILNDIVNRHPWSKIYEAKYSIKDASITDKVNDELRANLQSKLSAVLNEHYGQNSYAIDIISDTAFKDIHKTEVKLLVKNIDNSYKIKSLDQCGDKLDQYQSIKFVIRVFIKRDLKESMDKDLISKIHEVVVSETQ